ncbi:hypothetical protein I5V28_00555 [Stenotrophomonas maltophilia]|nr:hypothetical protein [Stenotrophomonas maltophilia]
MTRHVNEAIPATRLAACHYQIRRYIAELHLQLINPFSSLDRPLPGDDQMRPYNIVLLAVESFYSVETGDWPGMIELFEERLEQVQVYREGVRRELYESLSDSEFSWKSALWNDDCHVEEFDGEEDARSFIRNAVLRLVERAFTKMQASPSI